MACHFDCSSKYWESSLLQPVDLSQEVCLYACLAFWCVFLGGRWGGFEEYGSCTAGLENKSSHPSIMAGGSSGWTSRHLKFLMYF